LNLLSKPKPKKLEKLGAIDQNKMLARMNQIQPMMG